uniref:Ufm1-specific protease 2 n=1 Tax=Biomphalaria glabrata TaxID=6526 RepID=A0A2C9JNQ9_BIOGL
MATTVSISKKTFRTITNGQWSGTGVQGYVVGDVDKNPSESFSISCVWQSKIIESSDLKEDVESCLSHFPGGKNVVGFVFLPSERSVKNLIDNDQAGIDREFEEAFDTYSVWLEPLCLAQVVILCLFRHSPSDREWQTMFFVMNEESVTKVDCSFSEEVKPVIKMRVRAGIDITVSTESNTDDQLKSALDYELIRLQNQCGNFVFAFEDNTVILERPGSFVGSQLGWKSCRDIVKYYNEKEGRPSGTKKKNAAQPQFIIPVSMLHLITIEPKTTLQYAPIIQHHIGTFQSTSLSLPIDVLAEVSEKTSFTELFSVLSRAVYRQITALFNCLSLYTQVPYDNECLKNGWGEVFLKPSEHKLHTPEVFHFKPHCVDTSITLVYPKGTTEKELERERLILHNHLCLPLDQPLLRRGSAGLFLKQTAPGGYLLNTHIGLNDPPVKSATVALVEGYYSYHHYMQDRFDDDKWGCAYRSLQTICSWFKYQGYTERDIPTHREIQQALYDIGDKEQKFVGSRQWIGSFEVSYVLDHLLGVTSKFLTVGSGAELSTTGQDLINHFQTQGTPIMIGGGVLAHTILGVAYSEVTGDISFLILDPHYTGGEDIKIIQDKGWCGWKDMSFWNKTAHYNLCLPQKPTLV